MRSVRYLDAGLFHYQSEANVMPDRFKKGNTHPLAWAFDFDAARSNTFSKLIRYEGFLQREFSRAFRDLHLLQDRRRAQLVEAAASRVEAEPEAPPVAPEIKKTNRTRFPTPAVVPNGLIPPDPTQNPLPNPPHPSPGPADDAPQ
ncbi:MAG: hypothetical protein ABSF54_10640 [Bryobacteraceae bacterium]|jgi:hypothetical protein